MGAMTAPAQIIKIQGIPVTQIFLDKITEDEVGGKLIFLTDVQTKESVKPGVIQQFT